MKKLSKNEIVDLLNAMASNFEALYPVESADYELTERSEYGVVTDYLITWDFRYPDGHGFFTIPTWLDFSGREALVDQNLDIISQALKPEDVDYDFDLAHKSNKLIEDRVGKGVPYDTEFEFKG